MVIAWPINLNVSCKLHPYSLQRTRSPPEPRLPKRIRNMHPRNYYDLNGKDIDEHFSFISRENILWIGVVYANIVNCALKWYILNQESILENEMHTLLWDFEKQTDHLITARRPNLVIVKKKKKKEKKKNWETAEEWRTNLIWWIYPR